MCMFKKLNKEQVKESINPCFISQAEMNKLKHKLNVESKIGHKIPFDIFARHTELMKDFYEELKNNNLNLIY